MTFVFNVTQEFTATHTASVTITADSEQEAKQMLEDMPVDELVDICDGWVIEGEPDSDEGTTEIGHLIAKW